MSQHSSVLSSNPSEKKRRASGVHSPPTRVCATGPTDHPRQQSVCAAHRRIYIAHLPRDETAAVILGQLWTELVPALCQDQLAISSIHLRGGYFSQAVRLRAIDAQGARPARVQVA